LIGQRNRLDRAFQELDVRGTRLAPVVTGERQHLVRHVHPVDFAGGSDALRGQQDVDAAAGSEIQHDLAWLEIEEGCGIAAAKGDSDRFGGKVSGFGGGVQVGRDWISAAAGSGTATPGRTNRASDFAVFLSDGILDLSGHRMLLT
jgi:hypothetical protein